jgi:hypothetical protein
MRYTCRWKPAYCVISCAEARKGKPPAGRFDELVGQGRRVFMAK